MNPLPPHLFFGLDLGQRQDPAAVAILERVSELTGQFNHATWEAERELLFKLRHVERFPLGTPYVEIVRQVRQLIRDCTGTLFGGWPLSPGHTRNPYKTLVVDASGVGAPVVELFQRCDLGANISAITITSGNAPHSDPHGGYLVPRRDLITCLRILLEKRRLRIPSKIHDREALIKELLQLQDTPQSAHDDLVIATALAAWQSTRGITL